MTIAGRKLSILAVFAAFALFLSIMPFESAEAQRRGGFGPGGRPGVAGVRGGGRHVGRGHRGGFRGGRGAAIGAGVLGAAILGGALLAAPRARAVEVEEGPNCYFVRERVWDDYRDRWVRVNRRVCD